MDDVFVPDLAGWRRERLPKTPNAPALTLAPDWVCEILSPSTERLDRVRKLPAYARLGEGSLGARLGVPHGLTKELVVEQDVGTHTAYRNERNSSSPRPACFSIDRSVPRASSRCRGTTALRPSGCFILT